MNITEIGQQLSAEIMSRVMAAEIPNVLEDISPDFTVFGGEFESKWKLLLAGLWGIFLIIAVGFLLHGILGIAHSKGGHPGQLRESKKEAANAGIALGGLIAAPVIVSAAILVLG